MNNWKRTICVTGLIVAACLFAPRNVRALEIVLTDPNADYFDAGPSGCPRGDDFDDCWVEGYLDLTPANEYWEVFDGAWNAWNGSQPDGQEWTLEHGPGLEGTLEITKFDTYNDCPGPGGVEVRAFFHPAGNDPTEWYWAQGLFDNYVTGWYPHDGPAPAGWFEMDVNPEGPWDPPLYPYQYDDGHFYDKPGALCIHEDTVFFDAVALIVQCDYENRVLTAYEGFSYGFDFHCVHIPEPASLALLAPGSLVALRRRWRRTPQA